MFIFLSFHSEICTHPNPSQVAAQSTAPADELHKGFFSPHLIHIIIIHTLSLCVQNIMIAAIHTHVDVCLIRYDMQHKSAQSTY